ncbi:MAG: cobalamin-binding protein, partial [Ectothiorhodospiraceae bacterium]|nr:cobalamin-binding protein [Ectothiorhodospiraceae bacterium]
MRHLILLIALAVPALAAGDGPVRITDDTGRELRLERPAQRVVALAPHLTELVYALGADDRLVAVGAHSDYPPAARQLPQVGSAQRLDVEAVLAREPDLVLAWDSGNVQGPLRRLEAYGIPVYRSEPRRLGQVADNLRALGRLLGEPEEGERQAARFEDRLETLRIRHQGRPEVTVFYQVWDQPVMTINGEHPISEAMALCGGRNVFADLPRLTPRLDRESVVAADPDLILASAVPGDGNPLERWSAYPRLRAVELDNLILLPEDVLVRAGPGGGAGGGGGGGGRGAAAGPGAGG